tara:strand:+ start:72 stop:356 length:285 start_codon:yes stop_codon:yes gene_type:complete
MGKIINLENKRRSLNSSKSLTSEEIKKLEEIRDGIEKLLNTAAAVHREPLGVALAAARYSSMRLYELQGRAETMAFVDSCIQTVEISEDIDLIT